VKLITIDLGGRSAAAIAATEGRAWILGDRQDPAFADVGEIIRGGHLEDLGALAWRVGDEVSFAQADLLAPVLEPGAVFCVGLNYRSHILEMDRPLPAAPTIFDKLPRALTHPYAELVIPKAGSNALDYEGELCVVIGKGGRNIPVEDGMAAVAGFAVLNDVTMRDYQQRSMQWFAGKSWQNSTPWGPALVTVDEMGQLGHQELLVSVNGDKRQQGKLGDLVFGVPELVSDLSTFVELYPGDLIATGTPGGVGEAMTPKGYLADGDVVEVSIDAVSTLRNQITVR